MSDDIRDRLRTALQATYTIERELGRGGMATVYLARDVKHDRDVALKVLLPDLGAVLGADRFLSEIKTTAKLQHPHILALLDSGSADGLLFYVMPLVEGDTLRSRLDRERQLPIEDALRITTEVAGALDYAHRHGVIHRDIKPENILLQDGRAVVADFGIALAVQTAGGQRVTQTGLSLGTPQYMSPEQAMGEKVIDARTDVYALGAVLYELLTGEPPFTGATAQSIVAKVLTERPTAPTAVRDTIPRYVEAAVYKALAKLPADRFATAAQFAAALARPETMESAALGATGAGGAASARGVRRHVAAAPAVWAGLALATLAATWGWSRAVTPTAPPVARVVLEPSALMQPGTQGAASTLAISPDGSRIALIGVDSTRETQLWVRYLDRVEPVRVPGTIGAAYPFFSPDGESVGFWQDQKLRVVSLKGGAPVTVCDAPAPFRGANWGRDSSIVFSVRGALIRVAFAGGAPDTLLVPPKGSSALYRYPAYLPGERAVLFDITGDTTDGGAVFSRSDRAVTRLGSGWRNLQYVDGGILTFGQLDGSVAAVPFDPKGLRVTGRSEMLTDGVFMSVEGRTRFAVARTGAVAYLAALGDVTNAELMLVDRQGRGTALPAERRPYRFPRFSPDGRRLAVGVSIGQVFAGDIWAYSMDNGSMTRLTSDSVNSQPEWDPDGRSLVFVHLTVTAGAQFAQLFRVPADGSGAPTALLRRPKNVYESHLTPDRRAIVFREDAAPGQRDVLMASLDSPQVVTPLLTSRFDERSIALSPDGHWLAYVSNETGTDEVYVRKLEPTSGRWKVSAKGGVEPRWARTGEIFFRFRDSVYASRVDLGGEPRISAPKALFAGQYASSGHEALWDVSPDATHFAMVRSLAGTTGLRLALLLNWADHWRARR